MEAVREVMESVPDLVPVVYEDLLVAVNCLTRVDTIVAVFLLIVLAVSVVVVRRTVAWLVAANLLVVIVEGAAEVDMQPRPEVLQHHTFF